MGPTLEEITSLQYRDRAWLTGMRKLPVLDEEIGETLLFHVTSPDCIEK